MASTRFFTILKRTQSLTANAILTRRYYNKARTASNTLFARISPLGEPDISLVPVLDNWVQEGKKIRGFELQKIIRDLRCHRRYTQALQVSEWMNGKGQSGFSPADHAVQLDLIGRVRGLESAESYFQNLVNQDRNDKTYGALLNCYVREGLVDKSLYHMQKMKELGFASSPLNYNDLMCLYTRTGQLEKVTDVLSEMKENGITPDLFSYRICMSSCAARSDLKGVEEILEEMENQSHISIDWVTYSTVASIYVKASLKEKALIYLKKCEQKVNRDALGYNHLISLNASLGIKDEVMRLWGLVKTKCKKQVNRDYITMLGALVKLEELEEADKLLQEWESSCQCYDFRVPNVLLIGYCQQGLIEKAEAMLKDIVKKQKNPTPNSWAIIAAGYVNKQNMEKAFNCMKEALTVQAENKGWRPKANLISSILSWLGENGDVEDVEAFVNLLETKVPKDREIYHTLIKAYIRGGKQVDGVLENMTANKIDEDEETKTILSLRLKDVE
ncbi:pentatricopeptide repeat-containing protein, putative [Ricinus communis]|uniref:Pentatricopeptide repeat-containing protein, putative n=1 Tax=Ricinus communis TaxID=3988 RepID=B9SNN7_RICCO|nr:pentatricopeptide repeat-containing protein, putative [Ricinus communis]|eukprot:XP_002527601.1 pentatricopeptide repeat-containing protein At4g21705, mitochondrial isoform X1 [Ricinus communis]